MSRPRKFVPVNAYFQELFRTGLYKRNQGRVTRQITFAAVAITILFGLWSLDATLLNAAPSVRYGLPGALLVVGLWAAYRLVNVPDFADFLIAVEAEMNKVSWPTRGELYRSSLVVLVTIFFLATVLYFFDFIWKWIYMLIPEMRIR